MLRRGQNSLSDEGSGAAAMVRDSGCDRDGAGVEDSAVDHVGVGGGWVDGD